MPLFLRLVYRPRNEEQEIVLGSTSNSALLLLTKKLLVQEQFQRARMWDGVDPVLFESEKLEADRLARILDFLIPEKNEKNLKRIK